MKQYEIRLWYTGGPVAAVLGCDDAARVNGVRACTGLVSTVLALREFLGQCGPARFLRDGSSIEFNLTKGGLVLKSGPQTEERPRNRAELDPMNS